MGHSQLDNKNTVPAGTVSPHISPQKHLSPLIIWKLAGDFGGGSHFILIFFQTLKNVTVLVE